MAPLAGSPSLDELSVELSPEGGSVALKLVASGHRSNGTVRLRRFGPQRLIASRGEGAPTHAARRHHERHPRRQAHSQGGGAETLIHPHTHPTCRCRAASLPFLAFTTLTVALIAGFVVTIIDKEDFPDFGTAVWWAIVTLGTVGYGDVVPHTGWGRVVGSVVIIVGVTFIAFLTAVVTSLFVEEEQKTHRTLIEDAQRADQDETRRLLEDVSSRIATVETLLRDMQGQRR